MFAIVKTGGKQYRVAKDDKIIVENLNLNLGDKIKLDVLFAEDQDGKAVFAGANSGATVEAEVSKNFKDDKIIVFKKRRRQNSRRKNGHRQLKTLLKIVDIKL